MPADVEQADVILVMSCAFGVQTVSHVHAISPSIRP